MFRSLSGSVYFALSLGVAVVGFGAPAQATTTTFTQTINDGSGANTGYWGGLDAWHAGGDDVIQNPTEHVYEIDSMTVSRTFDSATGHNDLKVQINTNYVKASVAKHYNFTTARGPDKTSFGSLFFGPHLDQGPSCGNSVCVGAASKLDTYSGDNDRFNRVLSMPLNPNATTLSGGVYTGASTLYNITNPSTQVQLAYYPDPSQILSPVPAGFGATGAIFRSNQAVGIKAGAVLPAEPLVGTGSWTVDPTAGTLTFVIQNEDMVLGTDFVVAWTMTCANDVAMGNVSIAPPEGFNNNVPLPGAIVLMGTVLFGAGGIGQWRKRRVQTTA